MTIDLDHLGKLADMALIYSDDGSHVVHEEIMRILDPATVQELIRPARLGMTIDPDRIVDACPKCGTSMEFWEDDDAWHCRQCGHTQQTAPPK